MLEGNLISGTTNDDGGAGYNSQVTFTAAETGTYYIAAGAYSGRGTYEVAVTDTSPSTDPVGDGATDLGDITALAGLQFSAASIDGSSDSVDYWRFTLSEARRVGVGLRQQDANADLFLEDAEGNVLYSSTEDGTANEWISQTLLAGTYFVRVEAQEEGANEFKLRYGVSAANPDEVAALEQQQQQGTDEAPAFVSGSYAFSLAENADGGTSPVSLGSVSATDPEDSTIIYSIEAGNSDGLFAIDFETGALSYQGTGEDYESGTTSYELTVRAGDGSLHSDVTVTVNVTDVQEAPEFAEGSYAFDLAENADGGATSVALGAVSATDPENSTITYSIEAGDSGGLFAIDPGTGALSYEGAGEDYESGTTSYELTVRASDGGLHSDVTVAVNVTDLQEPEEVEPLVTQSEQSTPQTVSEPAGEDFAANISTAGRIAVGDTATGKIGSTGDRDGFAVELVAGRTYIIDLRGSPTGDGTLNDPYLRGIKGPDGSRIAGVSNDDGGEGYNSQLNFTPTESGTHYIIAGAYSGLGTYEVEVRDVSPQTAQQETVNGPPAFGETSYEFTLAENADGGTNGVSLGAVSAADPEDSTITYSIEAGDSGGLFAIDSETGALSYQGAGEDYESGATSYELTVRASDGGLHSDVTVAVNVTDVAEAPAFAEGSYAFSLAENADGGATRVGLGAVSATDPENSTITYSIEAGDSGGLFAIDSETGALSYQGAGEDYESGATSYELTVRASDGGLHSDVTVAVNVTDVAEAPAFAEGSYAFSVYSARRTRTAARPVRVAPCWARYSGTRRTVRASDRKTRRLPTASRRATPVACSTASTGDSGGLFAIDSETGALSYHGAGEDYESGTTSYELTVRASDGSLHSDVTVTVNVTDVQEAPAFAEGSYAFDLAENADGGAASVALGAVSATDPENSTITYSIEAGDSGGLFAIDSETGALSYQGAGEDYESGTTSYELTVRASDGSLHSDVTVTVNVTDVEEYVILAQEVTETQQSVSEPDGQDLPDGVSTTGRVAVGGSATGGIENWGDRDWFAVELEAGKSYRIDLKGRLTGDGTLSNPYLYGVYDADGNFIAGTTNDNGGYISNSRVRFTAEEDATYYVAAGAWGYWQGTYTLSVTDVTHGIPDDFSSDTGTTGRVAVGGSATGEIHVFNDHDWFAVELDAGSTYRIDLEGSWTGGGTMRNPHLGSVRDADGVRILYTRDDDGGVGWNSRVRFTATDAGTYYLVAGNSYVYTGGGEYDSKGTYTLSVTAVVDDFEAGTGTSGAVAVGGSVTSDIEFGDDRDWFAVELDAGRIYRIDLEDSETGDGTLSNPYLRGIYDADGNFIGSTTDDNGGEGANSRVYFTADDAGTYYVAAGSYGETVGTYTLSVTEVVDDFEAGTGTSGAVEVGGSATGEIEIFSDRDWFAVDLEKGTTYLIDLRGSETGDGTVDDPYLRGVYGADGNFIPGTKDNNGGVGWNSRVTFTAEEDATYYVAAGSYQDTEGTYTLSVTEPTDDFAAGTGTTGAVAVGGSVTGDIEFHRDRDWFAVELDAGKRYRIDLEGSSTGDSTLYNPYLRGVHDADGLLLAGTTDNNGGAGYNSRVYFTAEDAGTYYVAAGAYGSREGAYTLSVTEPTDDFEAETGTSGAVAVGGSATGEIEEAGDQDWFALTLEAGRTYQIDLEGYDTGNGTLMDPYLRGVYGADGNFIAGTTDDNGGVGLNSRIYFTAEDAGAYYVAAGANGSREGTYRLSVADVTDGVPDDFEAGTGTTGVVAVGGSATGEIETFGDRDWFAVELAAGRTYRIDLEGSQTGAGTLSNPYLRGVHDANGVLIPGTTADDDGEGTNSRVFFTAEDAGTYYVAAGAWSDREGTYTLSVTEVMDDFAAGTETTGTVEVGGSATGEIEYYDDRDWFAVELDAGRTYQIDLEGYDTGAGTLGNPFLHGVYDADGVRLPGTTNNNGGVARNSQLTFTAEDAGVYYVAAGAKGSREGAYTLSVVDITNGVPDDFEAGTGTSGAVAVGGSATGEIESRGDRDWFAVTLETVRNYRIDLKGYDTGDGTLRQPYLRGIYDADGNFIARTTNNSAGTGWNSRVFFTSGEAGTYYVAAGSYQYTEGTYTLSVVDITNGVPDDFEAGTGTSGAVAVGGSATGEIEIFSDRDWFAVELDAGATYRIDLKGYDTGDGTLRNPYLRGVHDGDGVRLPGTRNNNGGAGNNSGLTFTADDAGTYYVAAGALGEGEGTYTLSVEEVL